MESNTTRYLQIDCKSGRIYNYIEYTIEYYGDGIIIDTKNENICKIPIDAKTYLLKTTMDQKNSLLENSFFEVISVIDTQ